MSKEEYQKLDWISFAIQEAMNGNPNELDIALELVEELRDCPQEQAFISFGEDLTKDEIINACQTVMSFEILNDVDRFVFDMNVRFSKRNNMGGREIVITVGDDTNYLEIPEGWTPSQSKEVA